MATQSGFLQLMLEAISAMREAGYTREDVQELTSEAWEHLEGGGRRVFAATVSERLRRVPFRRSGRRERRG